VASSQQGSFASSRGRGAVAGRPRRIGLPLCGGRAALSKAPFPAVKGGPTKKALLQAAE